MTGVYSVTFDGLPMDLETVRVMFGARSCGRCGRHVSSAVVLDEDDRPTGEHRVIEMETLDELGVEHTADRCTP